MYKKAVCKEPRNHKKKYLRYVENKQQSARTNSFIISNNFKYQ